MNQMASQLGIQRSVTMDLAQAAATTKLSALPESVVEVARQCLLDWLCVTIAAEQEPLVCILSETVAEEGGRPVATIVGRSQKVTPRQAALVNGSASHALDYDDVNVNMLGHPTVSVLPAVLALAEARGASGSDFVVAFVAGYETAARLGDMVRPGHYARGFHVTGTVGAVAAAAGAARLLGLDSEQTAMAIGIAVTQAAGLKGMFGTMCKPLHAGKANENGVLAAELAARGFESRSNAVEGKEGFAATMSSTFDPGRPSPHGNYFLVENLFKYHACCYQTHAAIDAVASLRATHGFGGDDVERIELRHDAGADTVCNIAEPKSGLEAKFSLRMAAAMAVAGVDTSKPSNFSDILVADRNMIDLRDRVSVSFEQNWPVTRSEATIFLKDGRRLYAELDSGIPSTDLAAQRARLLAKFRSLTSSALDGGKADWLADLALNVDRLDRMDDITALFSMH